MRKDGFAAPRSLWVVRLAFALAVTLAIALTYAGIASAQTDPETSGSDGQYAELVAPSGPAASEMCGTIEDNNDNGLLDEGDLVTYPGDFSVAQGASVVVDDQDGTQGTFIDGENAEITGENGNIVISATGAPLNVVGGNGELSSMVCNSIVTTTGVSGDSGVEGTSVSGDSGVQGVSVGVLPDTGGSMFIVYGSALVAAGVGLALVRRRSFGRS